jgi:hypothetical protein
MDYREYFCLMNSAFTEMPRLFRKCERLISYLCSFRVSLYPCLHPSRLDGSTAARRHRHNETNERQAEGSAQQTEDSRHYRQCWREHLSDSAERCFNEHPHSVPAYFGRNNTIKLLYILKRRSSRGDLC